MNVEAWVNHSLAMDALICPVSLSREHTTFSRKVHDLAQPRVGPVMTNAHPFGKEWQACYLVQPRVGRVIREAQPIDIEVHVMHSFAIVSSIRPIFFAVVFFEQALIHPIPDEPSLQPISAPDRIPVVVHVT